MLPLTVSSRRGFCVEHHHYKSRGMLNQQEIVVEKRGAAKTIHDRAVASGGMGGKISSLGVKRTYEPRRLLFPAPDELDSIVSDRTREMKVRNDLHADPSCNLCQACIIIRLATRSFQGLLPVFHALPRDLVMTRR